MKADVAIQILKDLDNDYIHFNAQQKHEALTLAVGTMEALVNMLKAGLPTLLPPSLIMSFETYFPDRVTKILHHNRIR